VIALSVAAVLAVFLLYSSIAGGGTPALRPSSLAGHDGNVSLTGRVLKPVSGDAHGAGLRFRGRDIVVDGRMQNGVFVAAPGTMVTKCPSKYTPKKT
jgi:hypothetical protein